MSQRILPILCLFLFCQTTASHRCSNIIRVPQDHKTIQAAIDVAQIGDTILVDHGTYYENLRIRKNITLASRFLLDRDTSHIERTIIDGSRARDKNRASTIFIGGDTDTNCVVEGLTIQGGGGDVRVDPNTPWSSWRYGGGVDVASHGATVSCNRIIHNSLSSNGGVDTVNGGGVFFGSIEEFRDARYFILDRNLISDNHLDAVCCQGGGVYAYYNGRITNNLIAGNSLSLPRYNNGGGICISNDPGWSENPKIDLVGNRICGNSAPVGGGIHIYSPGESRGRLYGLGAPHPVVVAVNNIIAGNRAHAEGGGIRVSRGVVVLTNNSIVDNSAVEFAGGLGARNAEIVLFNNIVWNNSPQSRFYAPNALHANDNIFEGMKEGSGNIDTDPMFVQGDPLYHLSPHSPALGAGVRSVIAFEEKYRAPSTDALGMPRCQPDASNPDLGAVESEFGGSTTVTKNFTRLTVLLSYAEQRSETGNHHLKSMVRYIVDDSIHIASETADPHLHLSASENNLTVDFIRSVTRKTRHLGYYYFLEGSEKGLYFGRASTSEEFRKLEPGRYHLVFGMTLAVPGTMVDKLDFHSIDISVDEPWYNTSPAYVGYAVLAALALCAMFIAHLRRGRSQRLAQQAFSRQQIESQEAERKRIAGELHDGVGQSLLLASNELQEYVRGEKGIADIGQVENLLQESIQSVREMASNLHPHQLDRLGFCAAVNSMIDHTAHATGLRLTLHCDDVDGLLPREKEVHLYRIIQEALSNVVRHASAREATISIRKLGQTIEATVADDGKGFDAQPGKASSEAYTADQNLRGFGLSSMAERARIIGGTLKIDSSPRKGTIISVTVPYS